MRHSIFHLVTLYLLAWIPISSAQVPTLEPDKTVNKASGEMAFSLPLVTDPDPASENFPVHLGHKAGIMPYQPASTVGLGFDVGFGTVSRKVVMLADASTGNTTNTVLY